MESPRSHLRDLTGLSTSRVHLGLHAATQLRDRASPNHRLSEIRDSTPQPSLRTAVQDALCKPRPCTTTHADQGSSSCTPPRLLPEKPLANFITFLAASLEQGFLQEKKKKILERASSRQSCHLHGGCGRNFPSRAALQPPLPKKGSPQTSAAQLTCRGSRKQTSLAEHGQFSRPQHLKLRLLRQVFI